MQDHLTTVTDAEANVTTYVYSDRDLMTAESSQTTGLTAYLYNEHGELTVRTDARGVTMTRTIDALDRVTFESYPDNSLDVTYTYDDPLVPFSQGRLTRIARHGEAVDYTYDRFGRTTRDGALAYDYDANGNRTAITYPGNVIATSTYDYADRQQTLIVDVPGQPSAAIVTASGYYPSGPLQTLDLGNGLSETRVYDSRYHPDRITLAGTSTLLDWQYTTEPVGNITQIEDLLTPGADRTYDYQDYQYFLTQGDGPWGTRAWTYGPIGNRLSETRDGGPADVYQYEPNPTAGNSPKLDLIQLGPGGTQDYAYDAAGNQTQVVTSAGTTVMGYDAASRLSVLENLTNNARTDFRYDGRSFLQNAKASDTSEIFTDRFESGDSSCWSLIVGGTAGGSCPPASATKPTYSSDGLLHHIDRSGEAASRCVFYHAGMPVATLKLPVTGAGSLLFLTTDHLGTPVLASAETSQVSWLRGFEPFGGDYADADGQGVFLRFPGQWVDGAWSASDGEVEVYYNVHRWYQPNAGSYTRVDPLGAQGDFHPYLYGSANPLFFVDPTGEKSRVCCTPITEVGGPLAAFKHCFIQTKKEPKEGKPIDETFGLQRVRGKGCVFRNDQFDQRRIKDSRTECGSWNEDCETDPCVEQQSNNYSNPSDYQLLRGPNSNSFASTVAAACGLTPPGIAGTFQTPGWGKQGRPAKNRSFKCPKVR